MKKNTGARLACALLAAAVLLAGCGAAASSQTQEFVTSAPAHSQSGPAAKPDAAGSAVRGGAASGAAESNAGSASGTAESNSDSASGTAESAAGSASGTAESSAGTALSQAQASWTGWEQVDADALEGWLDGLGYDRGEDPAYPGLTADALQGTWYSREDDTTLTIRGSLCTITAPLLSYQELTVPYVLVDRAAQRKCPELLILTYPNQTDAGVALYISGMTSPNLFQTTNWGAFRRQ